MGGIYRVPFEFRAKRVSFAFVRSHNYLFRRHRRSPPARDSSLPAQSETPAGTPRAALSLFRRLLVVRLEPLLLLLHVDRQVLVGLLVARVVLDRVLDVPQRRSGVHRFPVAGDGVVVALLVHERLRLQVLNLWQFRHVSNDLNVT